MIILLLGDSGVGKTTIYNSYISFATVSQKDITKYAPTQGMDISEKSLKTVLAGETLSPLQLWDVGGSSLDNRNLINAIVLADVILFVYDITHLGSFNKLHTMLQKVRAVNGLRPNIEGTPNAKKDIRMPYIALIANKMDLEAERVIPQSLHDDFVSSGQFNSSFLANIQRGDQTRNWLTNILHDLMGVKITQTKKTEPKTKRSNSLVKEVRADVQAARNLRDGLSNDSICLIM